MATNIIDLLNDFKTGMTKIAPDAKLSIEIDNLPIAVIGEYKNQDGEDISAHTRTDYNEQEKCDMVYTILRCKPAPELDLTSILFDGKVKPKKD